MSGGKPLKVALLGCGVVGSQVARLLSDRSRALSPQELRAGGHHDLMVPGLYSWWVDGQGAADLSRVRRRVAGAGAVLPGLRPRHQRLAGARSLRFPRDLHAAPSRGGTAWQTTHQRVAPNFLLNRSCEGKTGSITNGPENSNDVQ